MCGRPSDPSASTGQNSWELRWTTIDDRGPERDAKSGEIKEQSRCRSRPKQTPIRRLWMDAIHQRVRVGKRSDRERMTNEAIDCQNDSQRPAGT